MKAVILVGGEGTRLRPLTCNTVKAMVPVLNRPFMEHMLGYLRSFGIKEVVLALCYLPNVINDYFGDGSNMGMKLYYVVEEQPLGTAGAVKNAEAFLNDRFLVLNGDIYCQINIEEMLEIHIKRGAVASIALTPVDDPTRYGVVEMDADNRILRFLEKPKREEAISNLINAGIYVLEPEILGYIPTGQKFMFEHHLFPFLLEKNKLILGYPATGYWIDMGTGEKYLQLHSDLLGSGIARSGGDTVNNVEIGDGCTINPEARLNGPIIIGERCVVEEGVVITGPTVIGNNCRIKGGAVVERCVLWNAVQVGGGSVLKGCIVCNNVTVGERCRADGVVFGDDSVVAQGIFLEEGRQVWCAEKVLK